ncbi:MAG: hypothetical protein R3C53_09690 [Pirellulaceae bacterium]
MSKRAIRNCRRRPFQRQFSIEALESRRLLAIDLQLVTDLNKDSTSKEGSYSREFFVSGDQAFFSAETTTHGREVWRTDGTSEGTYLVMDIEVGYDWSDPAFLGNIGQTTVFTASTYEYGNELYITDGSTSGTSLLKDIWIGDDSSEPSDAHAFKELVLFSASESQAAGSRTWRTDGTEAGTIDIGPSGSYWQNLGDFAYFQGYTTAGGEELWRTDGTVAGTTQVIDIIPGAQSSHPSYLTVFGSNLIFSAWTTEAGEELWISDGTAGGTELLKDILPGGSASYPRQLTVTSSGVLFLATNGSNEDELWVTDGTPGGTKSVYNFSGSQVEIWGATESKIYFTVDDQNLWQSDGTTQGTKLVEDGGSNAATSFTYALEVVGETVYFTAGGADDELWKISNDSVSRVADIRSGTDGSEPYDLTAFGDLLLFTADDGVSGQEPWISDGTTAGTKRLRDIATGTSDGAYGFLATLGDAALFYGYAADTGWELWKSDGTESGTQLVKDIHPGTGDSEISGLFSDDRYHYFRADDGTSGLELWRTDGTAEGTIRVADFDPVGNGSFPDHITLFGTDLFLTATTAVGRELIKLNPSTLEWSAVQPTTGNLYNPADIVVMQDKLYFSARSSGNDYELWVSDGSSAGTQQVADIYPGSVGSSPNELTVLGDKIVFRARHPDYGTEPWVSDGTSEGTKLLVDIRPSAADSAAAGFVLLDDLIFFRARNPDAGMELWRTDGSTTGTVLHADIAPGSADSFPEYLTRLGNHIVFFANDGTHGSELWRANASGTEFVKDIRPGAAWASVDYFYDRPIIDDRFYFAANDGVNGVEPWVSDGTPEGTQLLADVTGDSGGYYVDGVTKIGPRHLISGYTDEYGAELFFEANLPPTDILLSPDTINENDVIGIAIGTLTSIDANPWDSATFSLVAGAGDTNNSLFEIDGNVLKAKASFDHETQPTLSIRVRATDTDLNTHEKLLLIRIANVNEAPSAIDLSNSVVDENQDIGTVVGACDRIRQR